MSLMLRVALVAVLSVLATASPLNLQSLSRMGDFGLRKKNCEKSPPLVCVVAPTKGSYARGVVNFYPNWEVGRRGWHECHVRIKAELTGLSSGRHGFHIHTYGDIRAAEGTSTGGHFTNPKGTETGHGFSSSKIRHWGDLNNILARPNGKAKYNRTDNVLRLYAIVGRAMTIHAGRDKGAKAQPTGDAGSRVGTCVIGYANPDL